MGLFAIVLNYFEETEDRQVVIMFECSMTLNGEAFSVRLSAIELGYSHDMKKALACE